MTRKDTKVIQIGGRIVGGGNPVLIQSVCNTRTEDVHATVGQIQRLEQTGCDIIHVAVPTIEAASALGDIKKEICIPLVADIHLDYRLAIAAVENGANKIRINPGSIGDRHKTQAVVDQARGYGMPTRVGVNSGSLEKSLLEKYEGITAEGVVESVLDKMKLIENIGYDSLVISIKSSDVLMYVKARKLVVMRTHRPLHMEITESDTLMSGSIRSSVGLGTILHEGIGNIIRVSLTGGPVEEVESARLILRALGLRKGDIEVVPRPTCGRTRADLIDLTNQVENMVAEFDDLDMKVTAMGCIVNGLGEAREADIDITGNVGEGLLIRRGEIIRKVPRSELLTVLREGLLAIGREHRA